MNEVDAMVCRLGNYIVKLETALKAANAAYEQSQKDLEKAKSDLEFWNSKKDERNAGD